MDKCRLTIFTPVYNRANHIGKCYESMTRQKNQNFVWIIVDDGSTDALEDVVRPWLQFIRIQFARFSFASNFTGKKMEVCIQHTIWRSVM